MQKSDFYQGDSTDADGEIVCVICSKVVDFTADGWQEADPGVVCAECAECADENAE